MVHFRSLSSLFLFLSGANFLLAGCIPKVIRPEPLKDPVARIFALYQLEQDRKPLSPKNLVFVAQTLADNNPRIRLQALRVLDASPPPRKQTLSFQIDQQLYVMARRDPYVPARRLAIKLLATLQIPEEESLRTLAQIRQQTRSEQAKTWAHGSMCALQGGRSDACKQLCAALQHKSWGVRREAVRIQGLLRLTPTLCPLGVSKALEDKMIIVRYNAAFALGRLPHQSSPATQKALHKAVLDLREPVLVTSAAYALCKKKETKGCQLLLELMQHKNGYIRLQASRALLRLRKDAKPFYAPLQALLVHPEPKVAIQAAYVLCKLDQCELPLDTLLRAFRSSNKSSALYAQIALQKLKHRAVPALLILLKESQIPLQKRILVLLGRMRWCAFQALPTLQKMQRSSLDPHLTKILKRSLKSILAKP